MNKVFFIAKTTLREMLREKIFFVAIFIAVILFALSFLLGALSFDEQRKILADFGFLGIEFALLGISLFSGAYLLSKEIEKQTCLLILSRPVSRDQFILGKLFGVLSLNMLLGTTLGVLLWLLLGMWTQPGGTLTFIEICLSLLFESAVILALVIWISLVVRPVLALSSGFVIYLLGQWLPDLMFFAEKSKDALFINLAKGLHWLIPNLYRSNWKSGYFLEKGIPRENMIWMLGHMLGWFLIYILLTNFFFRRKDIV